MKKKVKELEERVNQLEKDKIKINEEEREKIIVLLFVS